MDIRGQSPVEGFGGWQRKGGRQRQKYKVVTAAAEGQFGNCLLDHGQTEKMGGRAGTDKSRLICAKHAGTGSRGKRLKLLEDEWGEKSKNQN